MQGYALAAARDFADDRKDMSLQMPHGAWSVFSVNTFAAKQSIDKKIFFMEWQNSLTEFSSLFNTGQIYRTNFFFWRYNYSFSEI